MKIHGFLLLGSLVTGSLGSRQWQKIYGGRSIWFSIWFRYLQRALTSKRIGADLSKRMAVEVRRWLDWWQPESYALCWILGTQSSKLTASSYPLEETSEENSCFHDSTQCLALFHLCCLVHSDCRGRHISIGIRDWQGQQGTEHFSTGM